MPDSAMDALRRISYGSSQHDAGCPPAVGSPAAGPQPIAIVGGISVYSLDQTFEPNYERANEFMIRELAKPRARIADLEAPPQTPPLRLHSNAHAGTDAMPESSPDLAAALAALPYDQMRNAIEDHRDYLIGNLAFPVTVPEHRWREWCRKAAEAKREGRKPAFDCYKSGKLWFVHKAQADLYLMSRDIQP